MRCSALLLVLVACSPPPAPGPRTPPAWIASTALDPAPALDAGVAPAGPPPPGCQPGDAAARVRELEQIGHTLDRADPQLTLETLRATLAKPCLAHVAPTLDLPKTTSVAALREAWLMLEHGLSQATQPLFEFRGKRHLILPREIVPPLSDTTQRELAWLACPRGDTSCARVESYIARAETAFDARLATREAGLHVSEYDWGGTTHSVIPVTACDGSIRHQEPPTTFEEWGYCVSLRVPRNRRFAERGFRALDKGWLVLRGRRGHYQAQDEIRAYDLATGAAYIVQWQTGVLMMPDQVKANDKGVQTTVGRVAPDQLREIAFVLLARDAIVHARTSTVYAEIPAKIPLALSGKPVDRDRWGRTSWRSSDQTSIGFAWFDAATRKTGSFTWPHADDWVDDHVAELVRIMEAGLVAGCAPAKLPPMAKLTGAAAKVSPIDADAKTLKDHYAILEAALDKLRAAACPDAR